MLLICPDCFAAMKEWDELTAIGARVKAGRLKRRDHAIERAEAYRSVLIELIDCSTHATARELNARGIPAPNGGAWYGATVHRLRNLLELDNRSFDAEPQGT